MLRSNITHNASVAPLTQIGIELKTYSEVPKVVAQGLCEAQPFSSQFGGDIRGPCANTFGTIQIFPLEGEKMAATLRPMCAIPVF